MSLLRTTATRSLAVNTVAPFGAARFYAEGPGGANSTTSSGGASSTGFKNREQGEETKYIMQAEAEKLQRLREQLKKQRDHLDDVEAAINDLGGQGGKAKK
ncbi:unnamed protein product [Jaminaea pallidilutea]